MQEYYRDSLISEFISVIPVYQIGIYIYRMVRVYVCALKICKNNCEKLILIPIFNLVVIPFDS